METIDWGGEPMSSEIVTLKEGRFVRFLCFETVIGISRPFPQQEHGAAILLECVGMQSSTIDRRLKISVGLENEYLPDQ